MNSSRKSKLRIIGGRWRGRNIEFLQATDIRPTPNRVRETLFNWLARRVESAACLDLFAGSGVLGFEAVSRGAASATLIENNPLVCKQLGREITRLEASTMCAVEADACAFIRRTTNAYNLLFIDPPFDSGLYRKTLDAILKNDRILAPAALIYIEWKAGEPLAPPAKLNMVRRQQASEVQYALFEVKSDPQPAAQARRGIL